MTTMRISEQYNNPTISDSVDRVDDYCKSLDSKLRHMILK